MEEKDKSEPNRNGKFLSGYYALVMINQSIFVFFIIGHFYIPVADFLLKHTFYNAFIFYFTYLIILSHSAKNMNNTLKISKHYNTIFVILHK